MTVGDERTQIVICYGMATKQLAHLALINCELGIANCELFFTIVQRLTLMISAAPRSLSRF